MLSFYRVCQAVFKVNVNRIRKVLKFDLSRCIYYSQERKVMSATLDKIINLFKWPIAVYMLLSLPALCMSVDFFSFASFKYLALIAGFFMYFIARTMADSSVKTSMQIIAHELTHSFFALITFHKVDHIRNSP